MFWAILNTGQILCVGRIYQLQNKLNAKSKEKKFEFHVRTKEANERKNEPKQQIKKKKNTKTKLNHAQYWPSRR